MEAKTYFQPHLLVEYKKEIEKNITALKKVAKRLKVAEPTFTFSEEYDHDFTVYTPPPFGEEIGFTDKYRERCFDLTINVQETIKMGGDYKLIAIISHASGSINQVDEETELPVMYHAGRQICDHCGVSHARNVSFVVKNDQTSEYKQLGKSCLKQHLGINPVSYVSMFEAVSKFSLFVEGTGYWKNTGQRQKFENVVINMDDLCQEANWFIQNQGYVKNEWEYIDRGRWTEKVRTNAGQSTSDKVTSLFSIRRHLDRSHIEYCQIPISNSSLDLADFKNWLDQIRIEAEEMWQQHLTNLENDNEYKYYHEYSMPKQDLYLYKSKLGKFITQKGVKVSDISLFLSALVKYINEKNKPEAKPSNFVGSIGDKMELELTLKRRSGYDTMYGWVSIDTYEDANGNLFVYKGTSSQYHQIGEVVVLKFKLKDHSQYKEIKQNIISHVKEVKKVA